MSGAGGRENAHNGLLGAGCHITQAFADANEKPRLRQATATDLGYLAFPGVWESDEELDEFLADLYASRRASLP
jgi:hypothetical protein